MRSGTIYGLWMDDTLSEQLLDELAARLPASVTPCLPGDRHLTLAMLPDADLLTAEQKETLAQIGESTAAAVGAALLSVLTIGQFDDDDGDGLAAVVAHVESADVLALRQVLVVACEAAGIPVGGYAEYHPHITLGYGPAGLDLSEVDPHGVGWVNDRLCLALGPGRTVWSLDGSRVNRSSESRAQRRAVITGGTMPRSAPAAADTELKAAPHFTKSITGRTVVGIFSVYGNRDSYDDILYPGVMAKTIRERGSKVLHLWQHDTNEPPIARVDALRELRRDELPPEVLAHAPEATGGCEVTRTYLETPRAQEVFTNLTSGVPLQMSFMFQPIKWDTIEDDAADWGYTRHIREVRLWETSDVNWGANDATMASKQRAERMALTLAAIDRFLTDYKAGARHSTRDNALINQIHAHVVDLGCSVCAGTVDPEDDAKAADVLAQRLLAVLEAHPETEQRTILVTLAQRLSRAVTIDGVPEAPTPDAAEAASTTDADPPAESRAADKALTPAPVLIPASRYQQRARAAAAALALHTYTSGVK